jgi:beta-mannosidase
VDAPPPRARYRPDGPIAARLRRAPDRVANYHDYQYRLTKFYIERCRLQRWRPNGGYIQFMWIDVCPQSWYGVLDHWGCPKVDGAGGALRAFREVGGPMAVLLGIAADGLDVWVVNDLLCGAPGATLNWSVLGCDGRRETGTVMVDVPPDGLVRAARLDYRREHVAGVGLSLSGPEPQPLAANRYDDIADHPAPDGYPGVVEHEVGVRGMP